MAMGSDPSRRRIRATIQPDHRLTKACRIGKRCDSRKELHEEPNDRADRSLGAIEMFTKKELVAMAKAHGLFSEQSLDVPQNSEKYRAIDPSLPPYDSDKRSKQREIMIRRLHKIIRDYRERL